MYGDRNNPVYEGSGGGGYLVPPNGEESDNKENIKYTELNGGYGGGFIYIEAIALLLFGTIDASGGTSNKAYSYLGSGKATNLIQVNKLFICQIGSGGSIQIHVQDIAGTGLIRANGGDRSS